VYGAHVPETRCELPHWQSRHRAVRTSTDRCRKGHVLDAEEMHGMSTNNFL